MYTRTLVRCIQKEYCTKINRNGIINNFSFDTVKKPYKKYSTQLLVQVLELN